MADTLWIGTRKGLFELKKSTGNSWKIVGVSFLGEPVSMLFHDKRDGAIYAALNLGHFGVKLHRSDDGAKTWTEVAAPAYPAAKLEQTATDPQDKPDKLELLWSLEAAGPDVKDGLWAGTIPGGLFKSTDRGGNWILNETLWNKPERKEWMGGGFDKPGIHSICVDPRDHRHVLIAVSTGGVWRTQDGGQTWAIACKGMIASYMPAERQADQEVQDVHRLVQSPTNPDHLWAQHHCGIFRSTDHSVSWRQIENIQPSTFGFAVAVHPKDPRTAWFVPAVKDQYRIPVDAKLVVTKTTNGGESAEAVLVSPVGVASYDLVYRHCLDVDETGNTLAVGSTTGHVWTSADGGKSWDMLPDFLPPIYVLRFGV